VVPGSLTVTPAVLTLTANNATRVFDTANPTFTGGYSGALNGDSFTMSFSTTASLLSDVGTYAIVPSAAGAALANYTVSATNGTLTITPMTGATITANNATRTYGTANPVFTGSISGAPANSTLTVTGTTTATQYSPVGSYAITPAISGISSADYAAAVVVGTLTITQATTTTTLTSSAPNSSYGQAVTLTAAVTPGTSGAPTGGVTFYVDGGVERRGDADEHCAPGRHARHHGGVRRRRELHRLKLQ